MSILAMNQNVFSSVFVGKKVSKEAKRAIEAEMIVPASAIEMTYDEMEYVDGGDFSYTFRGEAERWVAFSFLAISAGYSAYASISIGAAAVATTPVGAGIVLGALASLAGGISLALFLAAGKAFEFATNKKDFTIKIKTSWFVIPVGIEVY